VRAYVAVVAAHPDDETVGAASLLLRAHRATVVHVTDGAPRDPRLRSARALSRAAYARLRREEARAALAEAGLGERDLVGLGVADQEALSDLARLGRELASLLRALRPALVVTHAVEGGHPDHDATAVAVRAACALAARAGGAAPRLVEMTSYHLRGGRLEAGVFLPSPAREVEVALSPPEREAKRRMLAAYASQREVLAPFGDEVERFRRPPPLDLGQPPHPGPLHYEALGWETFAEFRSRARDALSALGLVERWC
jgi:N-acetylglucosamine malate deacetylase 2